MKTQITIQELAQKLNGKIWAKENITRLYIDRGYNTKKMSTKTYIFQRENGTFGVSCYIDCPSQDLNWIKSQQTQIIGSVEESIERAIYEIENPNEDYDQVIENKEQREEYLKEKEYFEKNKESIYNGRLDDYERAQKYLSENQRLENMPNDEKEKYAQLVSERESLSGVAGMKSERNRLDREIAAINYPQFVNTKGSWIEEALNSTNAEEYATKKQKESEEKFASFESYKLVRNVSKLQTA